MSILASLPGSVNFDSRNYGQVIASVDVDAGTPVIFLDVSVLTELASQYDPTGTGVSLPISDDGSIGMTVQSIVLKLDVEDIGEIRQDELISWNIEHTLTNGTSWSISLPASVPNNSIIGYDIDEYIPPPIPPAGRMLHETDWLAPPPALKNIDFTPAYLLLDNTEVDVPLMTNGVSTDSVRTANAEGHIIQISGIGPEGRYDKTVVCYILEPGHGLTHGEIIRDLAILAGVPLAMIAVGAQDGEPLIKPIEIINENWWDVAKEVGEGANLIPYFDEYGILRVRGFPPYENASTQFDFTTANIEASTGASVQVNADVPTCIKVTASKLVPPEDPCDVTTKVTVTETLEPFAIPVATHGQQVDGTIYSLSLLQPSSLLQVIRRVTVTTEVWGACQKVQEVITEEWYNPECHRYKIDTNGDPASYNQTGSGSNGPYFFETPVKDDSTKAFLWPSYRFVEISRVRSVLDVTYDDSDCGDDYPIGRHRTLLTFTGAWIRPEVPVKTGPPTSGDWDVTDFDEVNVYADGTGAAESSESISSAIHEKYLFNGQYNNGSQIYQPQPSASRPPEYVQLQPWATDYGIARGSGGMGWAAWECREWVADPVCETYVIAEISNSVAYAILEHPNGKYLFANGKQSNTAGNIGVTTGSRQYNTILSESTYATKTTVLDQSLDVSRVVYETKDGYLPALPSCDNAERENIQEFDYELCALLEVHERQTIFVSNDFIESDDALEAYTTRLLREATAITVTIPTAANFALRSGMKIHLEIPEARLSHYSWVHSVNWSRDAQGAPVVTGFTSKIYTI